jgi:hypothetical protein
MLTYDQFIDSKLNEQKSVEEEYAQKLYKIQDQFYTIIKEMADKNIVHHSEISKDLGEVSSSMTKVISNIQLGKYKNKSE